MKLPLIAAMLVLWLPSLTCTPCKTVLRVNKQAMDYACNAQRHTLQNAFKHIEIPSAIGTNNVPRINIMDVSLPNCDVEIMKDTGLQISIDTGFQMSGNFFANGDIGITADADIVADLSFIRSSGGLPILTMSACKSKLGEIQVIGGIGLLSSVMNVTNHILETLAHDLCKPVPDILPEFNKDLSSLVDYAVMSCDVLSNISNLATEN